MIRILIQVGSAIVLILWFADAAACAADPAPTTQSTTESSQPPDKNLYTLFKPVPADQLRGMDTDRPNQTNTPHTIDAGHLQIETGIVDYAYDRDRYHGADSRADSFALGQFNLRLGVLNQIELNAVINSADFARNTDFILNQSTRQSGFGDTIVGGKINLWGNDNSDGVWQSALAIQPQLKLASAREDLGNGHPELFVGVPFLINLPADFHLGLQTTVSWERNSLNDGEVTGWSNSASIDRVFFGKFDIYLEYWSHVSSEHHQEAQQTIDVGATYPVTDNLILDLGTNFGLNHASNTFECITGISVRF